MAPLELVPEPQDEPMVPLRALEACRVDLANAEAELTVKRRIITTLRKQLEAQVTEGDNAAIAEPAIEYWRWKLHHPTARSGAKRITSVLARLRDDPPRSMEDVFRAIDGCALRPYVGPKGRAPKGKASERHDDLILVCRDAETFERFLGYRQADIVEGRFSDLLRALCLPRGTRDLPFDVEEQAWKAMCPVCRFGWDDGHLALHVDRAAQVWCRGGCIDTSENTVRRALL